MAVTNVWGQKMKKTTFLAVALATTVFAHGAAAGSLSDPVIEAPVIIEDVVGSSSGTSLVAILSVIMLLASAAD